MFSCCRLPPFFQCRCRCAIQSRRRWSATRTETKNGERNPIPRHIQMADDQTCVRCMVLSLPVPAQTHTHTHDTRIIIWLHVLSLFSNGCAPECGRSRNSILPMGPASAAYQAEGMCCLALTLWLNMYKMFECCLLY